jgi:hypothetical protein
MVDDWARCSHFSSQTHPWYWEKIHVGMVQHLMKEEYNQECIFSCGNLHEGFCSNKQKLGAPKLSYTI